MSGASLQIVPRGKFLPNHYGGGGAVGGLVGTWKQWVKSSNNFKEIRKKPSESVMLGIKTSIWLSLFFFLVGNSSRECRETRVL